jgi:hypothetical protein
MALVDDLKAFWSLDEASGSRADSHSSNTLTDNNTVTQAAGLVGNAAKFTAANSETLSIADNADVSTGDIDYSVALWVYLDSKSAFRPLFWKWTTAGNQREYAISYDNAADRFMASVSGDGIAGTDVVANNFGSPSTGTWYLLIVIHDSVNNLIKISVNAGTENTTAHTTGSFNSTSLVELGGTVAFGIYHDGRMDGVALWKKALSPQERTDLYNSGAGLSYSAIANPRTIVQQPGSQVIGAGKTAVFQVVATGAGTLHYDWEVDTGSGFSNASGATDSPYYTTPIQTTAEDGDNYRCNVTDDNGTTVSASATLRVFAAVGGMATEFDESMKTEWWFDGESLILTWFDNELVGAIVGASVPNSGFFGLF